MSAVPSPKFIDPAQRARDGVLRLGAYVPGKPIDEVKREFDLDEVVKLASNESPLPPPENVVQAIVAAVENVPRYPDGHCTALRERVAAQINVPPASLLFGNGAEECVGLIGQAFLNPGDTGLIPTPIYDAYETAIQLPGATVVKVALKNFSIDLDGILTHVDDRTKIVWLCSPANPTGSIVYRREFDRFLDRLPAGVLVVLDEAYYEFVCSEGAAHAVDYLFRDDRVIGLRTFSKAYALAGLRIGYIVAHPQVIDIISMVKLPFNVNVLAQAAAMACLESDSFLTRHVAMITAERRYLTDELERRGLGVQPSETNFLLVETPMESDLLFRRLLPLGFIVRPGSIWGLACFIRISVGTREQNTKFLTALDSVLTPLP